MGEPQLTILVAGRGRGRANAPTALANMLRSCGGESAKQSSRDKSGAALPLPPAPNVNGGSWLPRGLPRMATDCFVLLNEGRRRLDLRRLRRSAQNRRAGGHTGRTAAFQPLE